MCARLLNIKKVDDLCLLIDMEVPLAIDLASDAVNRLIGPDLGRNKQCDCNGNKWLFDFH